MQEFIIRYFLLPHRLIKQIICSQNYLEVFIHEGFGLY